MGTPLDVGARTRNRLRLLEVRPGTKFAYGATMPARSDMISVRLDYFLPCIFSLFVEGCLGTWTIVFEEIQPSSGTFFASGELMVEMCGGGGAGISYSTSIPGSPYFGGSSGGCFVNKTISVSTDNMTAFQYTVGSGGLAQVGVSTEPTSTTLSW